MDAQYAETIVFRFIGYNLLGSAVRDVSGMLGGLSTLSAKASKDIGTNLQNAGTAVAGLGSAFILMAVLAAGGIAYATSKAAELQSQMILLHTQARVSTDQLPELTAGVLAMSGAMGQSPDAMAQALYYIESVGGGSYSTATALDELKAAAMGAAVGHSDLAQTATVLASVMAAFPGMLPIQAMGQLDAIVGQGKMTLEDLNSAMKTGILATLQSSGVSITSFGGALATMTDLAIPANQAANALRMAIYLMDAPTAASDKVLKQFGLTTAETHAATAQWIDKLQAAGIRHAQLAADLRSPGGIITALEDLHRHLTAAGLNAEAQSEVIYKAFGGGKMGKAIVTLYENLGRLEQKTGNVATQGNLLGQNFQYIQQHDPNFMWQQLLKSINALVIVIGQAFLPVVMQIMSIVTPLIVQLTQWATKHQDLVRVIGIAAVVFLAVAGAALVFVGVIGMIAGAIVSIGAIGIGATILPIIGIMLGVAVVVAAVALYVITHWDQVVKFFHKAGDVFNQFKAAIILAFNDAKKYVQDFITGVGNFLTTVEDLWKTFSAKPAYWIGYGFGLVIAAVIRFQKWWPNALWDAMQEGGRMLTQATFRLMQIIIDWLVNGVQWLHNHGHELFDEIIAAAVKSFAQFVTLGINIVQGIWQGIVSMNSWLSNMVSNFINGVIDGIKAGLGIHSPSRLFADEIGTPIVQGMWLGMMNEQPTLQRNVSTYFNPIISQIPSPTSGAASGSSPQSKVEQLLSQIQQDISAIRYEDSSGVSSKTATWATG